MKAEWKWKLDHQVQVRPLERFRDSAWFLHSGSHLWLNFPEDGLWFHWPGLLRRRQSADQAGIIPLLAVDEWFLGHSGNRVCWQKPGHAPQWLRLACTRPFHWSARSDGTELAVSSNGHIEIYDLPQPENWLRSWLPWALRPRRSLSGGDRLLAYDPITGELVYNREASLWRNDRCWLDLGPCILSTSGCTGHQPQAFSPRGTGLAIASSDGLITIDGGQPPAARVYGNYDTARSLHRHHHRGQDWLACAGSDTLRFFTLEGDELCLRAEIQQRLFCLQWLPDHTVLAMDWDGQFSQLSLEPHTSPPTIHTPKPSHQLRWSPPDVLQEWLNSDSAEFRTSLQKTRVETVLPGEAGYLATNLVDKLAWFPSGSQQPDRIVDVPAFTDYFGFSHLAISPSGRRVAAGRRFEIQRWQDLEQHGHVLGRGSYYYKNQMFALGFLDERHVVALTSEGVEWFHWDEERSWRQSYSLEMAALVGSQALAYGRGEYFWFEFQEAEVHLRERWKGSEPQALAVSAAGKLAWWSQDRVHLKTENARTDFEALRVAGEKSLHFVGEVPLLTATNRALWVGPSVRSLVLPGPVVGTAPHQVFCQVEGGVDVVQPGS